MEYFKSQVPKGAKYEYYTSFEPKEIISGQLKKLFHQYGYRQIAVPTFEYFDLFKESKGPLEHSAMLKFIDPEGDVLVLRPDCTLPIAKMVANSKEDPKYLRLSYISNVFRGSDLNESSASEFTQGGIEYFGDGSPGGEAEVILIAIKSLLELGFQDFQLDLSNIHFFKNLLARVNFLSKDQKQYKSFIQEKNFTALELFLEEKVPAQVPENLRELLRAMPNLYGKPEKVFEKIQSYNLPKEDLAPLEHLKQVVAILRDYGYQEYIHLDLSLINHFDYYDGTLFQGYLTGHGKVIVQGGRYDPLTESFGRKIPSLGFGINIDEVIHAMKKFNQSVESPYYTDYLVLYEDQERTEAFKIAETIRNKGFVVEMNAKKDLKEQIIGAQKKNIKEIIVYNENRLELIDLIGDDVSKVYQNTFIKSLDDKDRNFFMVPIH